MNSSVMGLLLEAHWAGLLRLMIDITLKGALICAVAGVATLILRRSSAYIRNMVWVFALAGLIILPAFSIMAPVWNLPIIPELGTWGLSSYTPDPSKLDQEMVAGQPGKGISAETTSAGSYNDPTLTSLPWYAWGILVWIGGGILFLCWCGVSHACVSRVIRKAIPASDRWNEVLGRAAVELDLNRRVRLLESNSLKAAITVGIKNPTVVLPAESEGWTDNRRSLVLSHELAHVKRWDTLIELFALFATVLYWFNPLVWFAVKQLRIERERDCDDAVLCTGARPSDYAELLMRIASDLGGSARPVWQVTTISQGSNLKDRLMSILNPKIDRRRGGRRTAVVTGLLVLAIVLPLSVSGFWNIQAQEKTDKEKQKSEQARDKQLKDEQLKNEQMKKDEALKEQSLKDAQGVKDESKKKEKMSAEEAVMKSWEKLMASENSAAAKVGMAMKEKGVEAGLKTFMELKEKKSDTVYFKEAEFNSLGYVFLFNKMTDEAIAVFELNVKEYPDSWNVYDSLGEALFAAGKVEKAVKNYETALKINPDSKSSAQMLEKIKHKVNKEA